MLMLLKVTNELDEQAERTMTIRKRPVLLPTVNVVLTVDVLLAAKATPLSKFIPPVPVLAVIARATFNIPPLYV
jgi:hypothetical protein